ncbi:thymidylate synthase [Rhizobium rhizogenes]|uniref:thymidylate synthase n=1 Tax=Rhizobium rhizogenes TaxID=359 RepID=UPI003ECED0F7
MEKNVTYSLINVLRNIRDNGSPVVTRGNEQVEVLSQLLRIKSPLERVIVTPHRNNNIFALIAETFWVLGGRNDLGYLTHYLPRASDFSDDGKTWRAAYGPRLRNWYGVDQFQQVASLLRADPNTKRAVMTIFDPKSDYVETKDVPCNNWLHFLIRDGRLHLNVTVRANDAVWGFGGINSFEWSILQEMMAVWTGTQAGTLSWFVGTIHVYKRHYKTIDQILDNFGNKTLYEFGIGHPKFNTPLADFDRALHDWFSIEERIRIHGERMAITDVLSIEDELLRNSLQLLYIYNRYTRGAAEEEIAYFVNKLPMNDFKIAAIEFFSRKYGRWDLSQLRQEENDFFEYYWRTQRARTPQRVLA